MSDLGNVWPPVPSRTDRLLLRAAGADARSPEIERFTQHGAEQWHGGRGTLSGDDRAATR